MKNFDAKGFCRAIYLNAEPSVDLDKIESPIDCRDYRLKMSVCDKVYEEFGVENGTDLAFQCNMWLLNSGPQLVEG